MNKKILFAALALPLMCRSMNQIVVQEQKPNLVFFGCQVTSNNPERATLVEIATIITDWQLNILAEGPSLIIHQPDSELKPMHDYFHDYFTAKYAASGLLEKIRASNITLADAEAQILTFIKPHTKRGQSPMVGGIDSRTIKRVMPYLATHLSTKAFGTFTLRELTELWNDDTTYQNVKIENSLHDAHAAIEEMRYYKDMYFKKNTAL